MDKNLLLVGLGNPGKKYEKTRHNVGWMFLDFLKNLPESEFGEWKEKKKLNAIISEGLLQLLPERKFLKSKDRQTTDIWEMSRKNLNESLRQAQAVSIVLAKPTTFMNNSGLTVQKLTTHYSLLTTHLIIIHDDIDIPFGEFKIQTNRGPAGHHGVESIIEHLGTKSFTRARIGISPTLHFNERIKTTRASNHVLKNFSSQEIKSLHTLFEQITQRLFS